MPDWVTGAGLSTKGNRAMRKLMPLLLLLALADFGLVRASRVRTVKLECKSENYGRANCPVGGPVEKARLLKRKSNSPCLEGTSYGFAGAALWVDKGCAGEFEVAYRDEGASGPAWGTVPAEGVLDRTFLECRSESYARSICEVDGTVTDVRLDRRRSNAPCLAGESFGFDGRHIWVAKGCGGRFEVAFRRIPGGGQSPTGDRPWWEGVGAVETRVVDLRCESRNHGRNICVAGGSVTAIRLKRQRSAAACERGDSFGFHEDFVWVDKGCQADFEVTYRFRADSGGPVVGAPPPFKEVERVDFTCKSDNYRRNVCYVPGRMIDARLKRTRSRAPCVLSDSFGYQDDLVWVDKGCEGEFEVTFRVDPLVFKPDWNYSGRGPRTKRVTCGSKNYRLTECGVGGVITGLTLRRTKSRAPCEEGATYGFNLEGVWVTQGCEAEFEVTYVPRP
jgi:hypothetical protein